MAHWLLKANQGCLTRIIYVALYTVPSILLNFPSN